MAGLQGINYSPAQIQVGRTSNQTVSTNQTQAIPLFSAAEDPIPNEIIQQAAQMPQNSKDVVNLKIEQKIHGFSGMYVDENGVLNLYTTDRSINSINGSLLAGYLDPYHLANGVIVRHSSHSWHKWMELENIVMALFTKGLGINSMGVDDKNQIYAIGFEKLNNTNANTVNKYLTDHKIPLDMVQLEEVGKIVPLNGVTTNHTPYFYANRTSAVQPLSGSVP